MGRESLQTTNSVDLLHATPTDCRPVQSMYDAQCLQTIRVQPAWEWFYKSQTVPVYYTNCLHTVHGEISPCPISLKYKQCPRTAMFSSNAQCQEATYSDHRDSTHSPQTVPAHYTQSLQTIHGSNSMCMGPTKCRQCLNPPPPLRMTRSLNSGSAVQNFPGVVVIGGGRSICHACATVSRAEGRPTTVEHCSFNWKSISCPPVHVSHSLPGVWV